MVNGLAISRPPGGAGSIRVLADTTAAIGLRPPASTRSHPQSLRPAPSSPQHLRQDAGPGPTDPATAPDACWQRTCTERAPVTLAMHPHPPIRWDRSPEEETRAFEALKPRLARLWEDVFPKDDEPYTSVIVPSVTLDEGGDASRHQASRFYE